MSAGSSSLVQALNLVPSSSATELASSGSVESAVPVRPASADTTGAALAALPLALAVFAGKVVLLGGALAAGEVFMAKLRMFRVPELLAGSFVMALLAVAASFFLA